MVGYMLKNFDKKVNSITIRSFTGFDKSYKLRVSIKVPSEKVRAIILRSIIVRGSCPSSWRKIEMFTPNFNLITLLF